MLQTLTAITDVIVCINELVDNLSDSPLRRSRVIRRELQALI